MKTFRLTLCFAALIFCTSLPLSSIALAKEDAGKAAAPAACCPAKPAVKEKSCCQAEGSVAREIENRESKTQNTFTRDSLYLSDATFTDDTGKPFALSSLRGRPVALNMFFASCGYACPLTVTDLLTIQARLPNELRQKAVFVLVSFDVDRDTPEALAKFRAQRGLDGRWILLHGDNDSVRELDALLGVKYKQEADGGFSHSNLVTILNGEGEIVHQRTGLQGGLAEAAAALAVASK